ncbi:MFS transporter [Lonepinella sp. MS14434]|uniref:MFS transporter n=1 Tax=Lonepinella sp. MS14434 TaxID=3003617 RepID=UPI0036D75F11
MENSMNNALNSSLNKKEKLSWQDWALLFNASNFKFIIVSFYMIGLITVLKDHQLDLKLISWIYLLSIFEVIKVVITPLLEKFYFKSIGKFKTWLLLSSSLLFASFLWLYFIDPQRDFGILMFICACLSLMSVIFGCATLGLTVILLPENQRGYGGVFQIIGSRLGRMLGGGLFLFIYQHYGWDQAILFICLFGLVVFLQVLFYRETHTETVSANQYSLGFFFKRLIQFWQQPNAGYYWFAILFLCCVPYSLLASTFVPKLSTLNWQPQQIGFVLSIVVPVVSIIFTPLSVPLLKKMSRSALLKWGLFIQIPVVISFYFEDHLIYQDYLFSLPIILLSAGYSILLPILMTLLMDKATFPTVDSSLQFTILLLGTYTTGFLSLRLIDLIGYNGIYFVSTLFAVLVWALAYREYNQ